MLCFLFRALLLAAALALAVAAFVVWVEPSWVSDTQTLELRLRGAAEVRASWLEEDTPGSGAAEGEERPPLGLTEEDRARLSRLLEEKLGE